jgi:hypothetical protein
MTSTNGQFLLSTEYVVMDAILVAVILAMYFIQMGLGDELNYMHIGILMARAYFKLPFSIIIIKFMFKVKELRHHFNMIHPKRHVGDFKSYKEKVLFIISTIR